MCTIYQEIKKMELEKKNKLKKKNNNAEMHL